VGKDEEFHKKLADLLAQHQDGNLISEADQRLMHFWLTKAITEHNVKLNKLQEQRDNVKVNLTALLNNDPLWARDEFPTPSEHLHQYRLGKSQSALDEFFPSNSDKDN
jgi:hypothetical protein